MSYAPPSGSQDERGPSPAITAGGSGSRRSSSSARPSSPQRESARESDTERRSTTSRGRRMASRKRTEWEDSSLVSSDDGSRPQSRSQSLSNAVLFGEESTAYAHLLKSTSAQPEPRVSIAGRAGDRRSSRGRDAQPQEVDSSVLGAPPSQHSALSGGEEAAAVRNTTPYQRKAPHLTALEVEILLQSEGQSPRPAAQQHPASGRGEGGHSMNGRAEASRADLSERRRRARELSHSTGATRDTVNGYSSMSAGRANQRDTDRLSTEASHSVHGESQQWSLHGSEPRESPRRSRRHSEKAERRAALSQMPAQTHSSHLHVDNPAGLLCTRADPLYQPGTGSEGSVSERSGSSRPDSIPRNRRDGRDVSSRRSQGRTGQHSRRAEASDNRHPARTRSPHHSDDGYDWDERNNRSGSPFLRASHRDHEGSLSSRGRDSSPSSRRRESSRGRCQQPHRSESRKASETARKRHKKEREKARRKAEKTVDPWLYESVPLPFVVNYLKRQPFRFTLLREFVLFVTVIIMFWFYTEYHSTAIEQSFFFSLGVRQQYVGQEFPTAGQQVDVFRQQEQNGFDLWLRLDSYFHDIHAPQGYLDFVRDVLVGSGNPPALSKGAAVNNTPLNFAASGANGQGNASMLRFDSVKGTPQWTSRSSIKAFTVDGGSPLRRPRAAATNTSEGEASSISGSGHAWPHRGHYFCGAMRMRTIRVRNGTGTLQKSLYRSPAGASMPFGEAAYVPQDIYARGHQKADEDTTPLCPRVHHPFPDRVARPLAGHNGSSVPLYEYVPCDAMPYHAGNIRGTHGTYHCGGHVVEIPFDYPVAEAQRVMEAMSTPSCRFLDRQATRLAVTELFVYIPSADQWLSVKFRAEVDAPGGLTNVVTIRAFRVFTSAAMAGRLAYSCVTLAVVALYLAAFLHKTVSLLRSDNRLAMRKFLPDATTAHSRSYPCFRYLCSVWPYLDVAFVVSAVVSFGFFFRWVTVSRRELPAIRASLLGESRNVYGGQYPVVLEEVQRLYECAHTAATVAVAVLFFRAIYFCHFFSVTRVLMIDMCASCAHRIIAVAFGFIVTCVGFALTGWSVFGGTSEAFATLGDAMVTLLQLFLTEEDFVPSALVEKVTAGDAQLNESFVLFYFWSYFALVLSMALSLLLSLTSLTYQELTQRTYIVSNDVAYYARKLRVWRRWLTWASLKRTLSSFVGLYDADRCHEELVVCLRRTRREREMQRITSLVEAKMDQIRAEATVGTVPGAAGGAERGKQEQEASCGASLTSSMNGWGSLGGKGITPAKLEAILGQSHDGWDGLGLNESDASLTATSEGLVHSLATLLAGSIGKEQPSGAAAATAPSTASQTTLWTPSKGAAPDAPAASASKGGRHSLGSAELRRVMGKSLTIEQLRAIITADMVKRARARRGAGSRGSGGSGSEASESESDDVEDEELACFMDGSGVLNYFSLTDAVPAQLFNACGGESFFEALWIDVVAEYAEMRSTTFAMEKEVFMKAVADVTEAKVGTQLARLEKLDATITQLDGHVANIISKIQLFAHLMAGSDSSREGS